MSTSFTPLEGSYRVDMTLKGGDGKVMVLVLENLGEAVWSARLSIELPGGDVHLKQRSFDCVTDSPFKLLGFALQKLDEVEAEEVIIPGNAPNGARYETLTKKLLDQAKDDLYA